MKDVSLDVAAQHNDDLTRRIKLHFACVSDLPKSILIYTCQLANQPIWVFS